MDDELRLRLLNAVSGILNGLHELQADYAREVQDLAQLRQRYQEAAAELIRLRAENIRLHEQNNQLVRQVQEVAKWKKK